LVANIPNTLGFLERDSLYAKHILGSEVARQVASNRFSHRRPHTRAGPLGFYAGLQPVHYSYQLRHYTLSYRFLPLLSCKNPDYARRVYLKMVQIISGLVIRFS
jgi:hypothetical protein